MLRRHLWRWITVAMLTAIAAAVAAPAGASAATSSAIYCPLSGAAVGVSYCNGGCPIGVETLAASRTQFAPCYPTGYRLAGVGYKGWTYLNLNYCAPRAACVAMFRQSMSAWSWTNGAWKRAQLDGGWVYTYPYTGSWRWAWTQRSGWVAVNSGRFEIRPY
jgi:hypothetical protein